MKLAPLSSQIYKTLWISLLFLSVFLSASIYAKANIELTPSPYATQAACKKFSELQSQFTQPEQSDTFKIEHNQYISVALNTGKGIPCYYFNYYPETSRDFNITIHDHKLSIMEMVGSTLGGNWLEKHYKIDVTAGLLIYLNAEHITFFRDNADELQEIRSAWQ